jgi:phosphoribosyl 1,2-cyclic phosphate phosphodiesterase
MDAHLLGTGTSHGMPAPLCECEYCDRIERKRPSMYVKNDSSRALFDVSPDFPIQANYANLHNISDVFVTHHHHDHSTGLMDLYHTTRSPKVSDIKKEKKDFVKQYFNNEYTLHLSEYTLEVFRQEIPYIIDSDMISVNVVGDSDTVKLESLEITPIIAEHTRGYLGFKIYGSDDSVVYIPDYGRLNTSVEFDDTDILVGDGGTILGYKIHGVEKDMARMMEKINPSKTYLVNVSEHISQRPTEFLERKAEEFGAKVVSDGYKIT